MLNSYSTHRDIRCASEVRLTSEILDIFDDVKVLTAGFVGATKASLKMALKKKHFHIVSNKIYW